MAIRILSNQTIDSTLSTAGAITSGGNLRVSSGILRVGNGSNTTARIMGFGDSEMITGVSGATYLRESGGATLCGTLQGGQYVLASGLAYGAVNSYTQIIDGSTGVITGSSASFTGNVTSNNITAPAGFLGGSNGGLRIHSGGTKFFNITAANVARDNIMDIGASDARFKDLILFKIEESGQATFAGDVTATGNYTAGNSKIIYKAQRSGGAVAGDWSYDDATTDMSLGTSTSHSFSLKTGNTRALTINSSQNATFAGTGTFTTATNRILTLDSTTTSGGYTLMSFKQLGTEQFRIFGNHTENYLSFYNDQGTGYQLTLASDGNVGIGTDSPSTLLHVNKSTAGDAILTIQSTSAGDPGITMITTNNRTGNIFYKDGAASSTQRKFTYDHAAQAFKMFAHNTTVLDFYVSETSAYFPSQNVGIGTTSPQNDKLHIETDTSTVYNGNSNETGGLFVNNIYHEALNTFSQIRLGVSGASGASTVRLVGIEPSQAASDFAIVLRNGSTWGEKLRIKGATGNVGIGTDSPNRKLTIFGGSTNNYLISAKWYSGSSNFSNPFITIISNFTNTASYPQIVIKISLIGHGISANRAQFTEAICTYDLTNGDLQQTTISHKTVGTNAVSAGAFSVSGTSIGFTPLRQTNYDGFHIEADIQSYSATFDY